MPNKQSKPEDLELTRKEHARRRKNQAANRKVVLFLAGVGLVLLALLVAGIVQALVITPRQPIAAVNGTNITLAQYQKAVKFDWAQNAQDAADPSGSSVTVLDTLVDDQLLREQARQKGITVSQQDVTDAIEHDFGYYSMPRTATPAATATPTHTPGPTPTNTPGPSPTPTAGGTATSSPTPAPTATPVTQQAYQDAYKQFLTRLTKQTGMSEADFRQVVETDLLKKKLYDQVTNNVPKTAAEIRVRHILVAIRTPQPTPQPTLTGAPTATGQPSQPISPTVTLAPGQPTPAPTPTLAPTPTPLPPRDDAQALARIIEAQQKLGAGGDFATVAKEYSDDTGSAAQGGELGWLGKGQGLDPAFETAAFAAKVGEISQPVKSSFGYHIIQVEESDPNHLLDSYTYQQNQYTAWTKWLDTLRQAAKITRNWSADKVPATPVAAAGG
jgi:parvulin-like peptidyl-prolyl isomerase